MLTPKIAAQIIAKTRVITGFITTLYALQANLSILPKGLRKIVEKYATIEKAKPPEDLKGLWPYRRRV